jgi:hypothetical protein
MRQNGKGGRRPRPVSLAGTAGKAGGSNTPWPLSPADKFPLVLDLNGLARVDRFEDWQKSGPVVQFAERQMRPLVRISKEST